MSVVVGVDPTPASMKALEFAVAEAALRDAHLRIVYAAEPWSPSPYAARQRPAPYVERAEEGRRALDRARDRALETIPPERAHTQILEGQAAKVMIDESEDATMVVLSARPHGKLRSVLLGSVTAAVAAHAHGSVIVVRGEVREPGSGRRVVVGTDGSAHSDASLRFSFEEAALRKQRLDVVHAWQPYDFHTPSELRQMSTESEEPLRRDVAEMASTWPTVDVRTEVVSGRATSELVKRSSSGTELLVVGHRGAGGALTEMLLGSVSQAVLHHSDCPVAIVREQHAHH